MSDVTNEPTKVTPGGPISFSSKAPIRAKVPKGSGGCCGIGTDRYESVECLVNAAVTLTDFVKNTVETTLPEAPKVANDLSEVSADISKISGVQARFKKLPESIETIVKSKLQREALIYNLGSKYKHSDTTKLLNDVNAVLLILSPAATVSADLGPDHVERQIKKIEELSKQISGLIATKAATVTNGAKASSLKLR